MGRCALVAQTSPSVPCRNPLRRNWLCEACQNIPVPVISGARLELGCAERSRSRLGRWYWPAPRQPDRFEVESVTKRRRTDEGQPVQRGANHWDPARAGSGSEDPGGLSAPRDLGRDLLQMEG